MNHLSVIKSLNAQGVFVDIYTKIKRLFKISTLESNRDSFAKYHRVFDHMDILKNEIIKLSRSGKFRVLDVGGGDGSFLLSLIAACGLNIDHKIIVDILDLDAESASKARIWCGDICSSDFIQNFSERYDCIFTYNAFEHFQEPFVAAKNMVNLLLPGGVLLCSTVFAWRFHPVPNDYFRYSDQALEYIFSVKNGLKTIECGYDLSRRRENIIGGYWGDRDVPPLDELGGFRENWIVTYVGMK